MGKKITMDECLRHFNEYIMKHGAEELYHGDFINWKNMMLESGNPCSEIFARFINELYLKELEQIPKIERKSSYRQLHGKDLLECKCELKKSFISSLADVEFENIGRVKDYNLSVGDAGGNNYEKKIDLLAINVERKELWLLGTEYIGDRDTILKAILKMETYFREIDSEKFKRDYEIPSEYVVKKGIIISPGSDACFQEEGISERAEILRLLKNLNISLFNISISIELSEKVSDEQIFKTPKTSGKVYPLEKI